MKIFYLRDEMNRPVAMVLSEPSEDLREIHFAVATWNLDHDIYDKSLALRIATGRLLNGGRYTGKVDREPTEPRGIVKQRVMEEIVAGHPVYPTRARNAAYRWLAHKAFENRKSNNMETLLRYAAGTEKSVFDRDVE